MSERGKNQDDLVSQYATRFVEESDEPFFAYLATNAPHPPAKPPDRYEDAFEGAKAPRTPSFNEQDVSDKPRSVRNSPSLSEGEIDAVDARYRQSLQSMGAVNDMLDELLDTLEAEGKLENTYIFFTSDNGYLTGQHRIKKGKDVPYEESIKVPLMVRGPDVPEGTQNGAMVLNNDLAPTFADLAGVGAARLGRRPLVRATCSTVPKTTTPSGGAPPSRSRVGARAASPPGASPATGP